MTQSTHNGGVALRWLRRPWIWGPAVVLGLLLASSWWFAVDLEPPVATARPLPKSDAKEIAEAKSELSALSWPTEALDGEPAKRLLLDILLAVQKRLDAVECYTATLRRRERIGGKLGEEQTLELKVRHHPFAIYLKFQHPEAGREIVYAEGRYDNHLIAHAGGLSRALIPRLKVPPTSRLALAGNRHPVTEAGLSNLTAKLIHFRRMDLHDPEASTILDRVTDAEGRSWLRSVHNHPNRHSDRPFAYVEVLYHPETMIPLRISSYDWPEPGDSGELKLAERYFYDDLKLDAVLTDLDFDPANPSYAFKRF